MQVVCVFNPLLVGPEKHDSNGVYPLLREDIYHSRLDSVWEMIERQDPVVWGKNKGPLTEQQLEDFERDGFVVLDGCISPGKILTLREEASKLANGVDPTADTVISEPESGEIRSIFDVHLDKGIFADLASSTLLAGAARQILGSDVYLHQSRINFKPGFDGREFYWHSDFETWHVEDRMPRMRALSASVLLTDNSPVNGPLMLIPKSHKHFIRCVGKTPDKNYQESLKAQRFGVPPQEALTRLVEANGIQSVIGAAGSVVLFDSNTLHGSSGNLSPHPRHNVIMVYNSVENKLKKPFGGTQSRPEFLASRDATPIG